jgi:hypothetical protein
MIPTASEFIRALRNDTAVRRNSIEYATVGGFSKRGKPLLKFGAEGIVSRKEYRRMRHVTGLRVGDRVRLRDGIIDGIID